MSENERSNEQRGNSDGEDQKKLPAVSAGKRILLVTFGCPMGAVLQDYAALFEGDF